MRPETFISLALYKMYRERERDDLGFRADVLDVLDSFMKQGVSSRGIRFRATPRGRQSEEVSEFIGRLSLGGYVVQESPIRLTEAGVSLLEGHLCRALASGDHQLQEAVRVLGLDDALEMCQTSAPPA